MSDLCNADGVEIFENTEESGPDRRKFNIHVDEHLHAILLEKERWKTQQDTGKRVFGYLATDEGFEAARADDDCKPGS